MIQMIHYHPLPLLQQQLAVLTPMAMVEQMMEEPVAFQTRLDKRSARNIKKMVDDFIAFQAEEDPTKDWTTRKQAWEDKNKGLLGCIMATFATWLGCLEKGTLPLLDDLKILCPEASLL